MSNPKYKKYDVYHKNVLIESISAVNKEDAIWGTRSVNDSFKRKDMKAIEALKQ